MEENTHDLQSMVLSFIFILQQYTTHTHICTHIYIYEGNWKNEEIISLYSCLLLIQLSPI